MVDTRRYSILPQPFAPDTRAPLQTKLLDSSRALFSTIDNQASYLASLEYHINLQPRCHLSRRRLGLQSFNTAARPPCGKFRGREVGAQREVDY